MVSEKNNNFPKEFFKQSRPTISIKEALKDVIPMKWKFSDGKDKKKVILISSKEKGIIR